MQLYFVKATYTNNVYKVSDFFLSGDYKTVAGKMLDINFMPNDGRTRFITRKLQLPDHTYIREHTHIIVPDYDKIYKIESIDYINDQQAEVYLNEDSLIGNYLELEDTDMFLHRTNDVSLFRGQNDVSDLTLKETVSTTTITNDFKTGKWALLFYQYPTPVSVSSYVGINNITSGSGFWDISESSYASLATNYPEVTTDDPEKYDYFQKIANLTTGTDKQCVYYNGALKWVDYSISSTAKEYIPIQNYGAKLNKSDVITICVALPFEGDLYSDTYSEKLTTFNNFISPTGTDLIDVKIVNDLVMDIDSISYSLSVTALTKTVTMTSDRNVGIFVKTYSDTALSVLTGRNVLLLFDFKQDIDISQTFSTINPVLAEPFFKYELYIYGQRYSIPYYLTQDIHLLITPTNGVINYLVYYNDKRNILASGSFTHSLQYSIDGKEAFYSENPTYKDQFYLKMGGNAFKTIAGGAMAGGMAGPIGVAGGAATGVLTAGVDAGLSIANLHYMEKGLALKPDQIYGEPSELTIQLVNLFGIYWVKKQSENIELMRNEYDLRGYPTSLIKKINQLTYAVSVPYSTSKVVFGEVKEVIKNEFTTNKINEKLKQGIILVP